MIEMSPDTVYNINVSFMIRYTLPINLFRGPAFVLTLLSEQP